jgi:ribonuclease VapC
MILDTSAVVAIFFQEHGWERLAERIAAADHVGMGAPTLAEAGLVLSARLRHDARGLLARFLRAFDVEVVPFGEAHHAAAVEAWLRFGKGRHPAALNFGDCLAYAVAWLSDRPLLCVGEDFRRTDLPLA